MVCTSRKAALCSPLTGNAGPNSRARQKSKLRRLIRSAIGRSPSMLTHGPVAPGGYSPRRDGVVPVGLRLGNRFGLIEEVAESIGDFRFNRVGARMPNFASDGRSC